MTIVEKHTKKVNVLHTVNSVTSTKNYTTLAVCVEAKVAIAGLPLVAALEAAAEANLIVTEVEAAHNVAVAHLVAVAAHIVVHMEIRVLGEYTRTHSNRNQQQHQKTIWIHLSPH